MATCFITNWVSVLLEVFEWSLFPFNPQISHNTILLPTHRSCQTSNFIKSAYLPHWIWSSVGSYVCHRSGASRSYGLHPYRAGKLHDVYPSDVSGFLSLLPDTWHPVCGIGRDSVEISYFSKPFRYLAIFHVGPASDGIGEFLTVFYFLALVARGFSFTEGFAWWYVISDLSLIAYQKPPPFLQKTLCFIVS